MANTSMTSFRSSAQAEFKVAAKQVGKNLRQKGYEVPHSVLLHALSAALGHTDWHTLKARMPQAQSLSAAMPQSCAASGTPERWLPSDPDTLFWVRLALFKGQALYRKLGEVPQWTYLRDEREAPVCATAKQAARRALNELGQAPGDQIVLSAVLEWEGWVLPVDIDMDLLWVDGAQDFAKPGLTARAQLSGSTGQKATVSLECIALSEGVLAWRVSPVGLSELESQLAAMFAQPFVLEHDRFEVVEVTSWFAQADLASVQALGPGAVQGWRALECFSDFALACAASQTAQTQGQRPVWVIDRRAGGAQVVFKPVFEVQMHPVKGHFHTDDRVYSFEFEAGTWLNQASDAELRALLDCGLGADYAADNIAYWMETRDAVFKNAFVYLQALQNAGQDCGFEVRVDAVDFGNWMQAHRLSLLDAWLCEHFKVSIQPATAPEMQGQWCWQETPPKDEPATPAFDSKVQARRHAAQTLCLWQGYLQDQGLEP